MMTADTCIRLAPLYLLRSAERREAGRAQRENVYYLYFAERRAPLPGLREKYDRLYPRTVTELDRALGRSLLG